MLIDFANTQRHAFSLTKHSFSVFVINNWFLMCTLHSQLFFSQNRLLPFFNCALISRITVQAKMFISSYTQEL